MDATAEQLRLIPQTMSYRGTAVARLDGQAVFIEGALPGEEVVVEVQQRRRDFLEGQVVEVVQPSADRVQPRCAHFGETGSCEWEYIAYVEQLRLKEQILRDQFRRIGHFADLPLAATAPSPEQWGYRNHGRFVVDREGQPSYLRRGSHLPVPVHSCAVLDPWINAALPALAGHLRGLASVEIRHGANTGESLITPSLERREIDLPSGQPYYHEELLSRRYRVSAGSFFQVNTRAAEELARLVLEGLALSGSERVADLYAGVGTFACLLSPLVRAVVAIEASPEAVEDGRLNSGFLENVRYRKGTVAEVLPRILPVPDAVVLDPPRAGCERAAIAGLLNAAPARIAYVSCDAATQARDIRLLVDGGYQIESLRVVDIFPQTYHIESLALLTRGQVT
ncbi:MAG: class I SAM-dependent RNA methyltransferase [Dehalococcoidia bacterium]